MRLSVPSVDHSYTSVMLRCRGSQMHATMSHILSARSPMLAQSARVDCLQAVSITAKYVEVVLSQSENRLSYHN